MQFNGPPKVLILEGQLVVAADVSLQLSKLGYEVIGFTATPGAALKIIEETRPDMVIMSVKTGCKQGGRRTFCDFARELKIPVIFLSGSADRWVFDAVMRVRPYAFIIKPFRREDLQRGLQVAFDRMVAEGIWKQQAVRCDK